MIEAEFLTACGSTSTRMIPDIETKLDVFIHNGRPVELYNPDFDIDAPETLRVYVRRFRHAGTNGKGLPLFVEEVDPKLNPTAVIGADLLKYYTKAQTEAARYRSLADYWCRTAAYHAERIRDLTKRVTHLDVVG